MSETGQKAKGGETPGRRGEAWESWEEKDRRGTAKWDAEGQHKGSRRDGRKTGRRSNGRSNGRRKGIGRKERAGPGSHATVAHGAGRQFKAERAPELGGRTAVAQHVALQGANRRPPQHRI